MALQQEVMLIKLDFVKKIGCFLETCVEKVKRKR